MPFDVEQKPPQRKGRFFVGRILPLERPERRFLRVSLGDPCFWLFVAEKGILRLFFLVLIWALVLELKIF